MLKQLREKELRKLRQARRKHAKEVCRQIACSGKTYTKAKPYQKEGVLAINEFDGRCLLADEMGLGKSFQSLRWGHRYYMGDGPIVVITLSFLKIHWYRDAKKHINIRPDILEGMTVPKKRKPGSRILVVNFDILGAWLKWLIQLKPGLVIIDECQAIKNLRSKRYRNVRKLCRKVAHVIALSGTPLVNRPAELWPTLNILRPDKFRSFMSFARKYCSPERKPWGWTFNGATRLRHLHRRLRRLCMVRRLKEDVLTQLPKKIRDVVPLELSRSDRKEYDKALNDFINWLRKQSAHKAKKAAKAQSLVKGGYLKRLVAEKKFTKIVEWIDNFLEQTEDKLLVFGISVGLLERLHAHYKNISVLVNGSVTGTKRQNRFDRFENVRKCRLCFGNMVAAGAGWSCTAPCVAFIEMAWTPGDHDQAEDRIHGLGRGKVGRASQVFYLIAVDTIEERLCKIIDKKRKVRSAALDGKKGSSKGDIFNQLCEELLKRK